MTAVNPGIVGLQHWWTMNEASGNRADSYGGVTLTDVNTCGSAAGVKSNAADFIAANAENLSCTDTATLSMGDIDFSISFWMSPDLVAGTYYFMAKGPNTGTAVQYEFFHSLIAGVLTFYVANGSAGAGAAWGSGLSADTMYHVLSVHDAANNKVKISVNNGAFVEQALTTGSQNTTNDFSIARLGEYNGLYYDGLIDEVSVWKTALSLANGEFLYNGGAGVTYTDLLAGRNFQAVMIA